MSNNQKNTAIGESRNPHFWGWLKGRFNFANEVSMLRFIIFFLIVINAVQMGDDWRRAGEALKHLCIEIPISVLGHVVWTIIFSEKKKNKTQVTNNDEKFEQINADFEKLNEKMDFVIENLPSISKVLKFAKNGISDVVSGPGSIWSSEFSMCPRESEIKVLIPLFSDKGLIRFCENLRYWVVQKGCKVQILIMSPFDENQLNTYVGMFEKDEDLVSNEVGIQKRTLIKNLILLNKEKCLLAAQNLTNVEIKFHTTPYTTSMVIYNDKMYYSLIPKDIFNDENTYLEINDECSELYIAALNSFKKIWKSASEYAVESDKIIPFSRKIGSYK